MAVFEIGINTRYENAKWLKGQAVSEALYIDPSKLAKACERSIEPGMMALRSNVNRIPARTGALRRSPVSKVKLYGNGKRATAVGLVGFKSGIAPHAYYIEFGASRALQGSTKVYRPLGNAFDSSRSAMQAVMTDELAKIMADAANNAGR